MNINLIIGTRIKSLREKRNEKQGDIAALLKISRTAISRYESGERVPDYDSIIILSQHYNVSTDYLLGITDTPNTSETSVNKNDAHVNMFIPSNIDLIRGSMSYEEMSKDMSLKMANPLYKAVFNADYLKGLANGKIQATMQTIDLLAAYAKVDSSFFYKYNTEKDLENAARYVSPNEIDGEFKSFVFQSDDIRYIKFAMALKDQGIDIEKLNSAIEIILENPDDWRYLELALNIKKKGINPDDIIGFSLKYNK
jgi:Predicted transcriptional regulators